MGGTTTPSHPALSEVYLSNAKHWREETGDMVQAPTALSLVPLRGSGGFVGGLAFPLLQFCLDTATSEGTRISSRHYQS